MFNNQVQIHFKETHGITKSVCFKSQRSMVDNVDVIYAFTSFVTTNQNACMIQLILQKQVINTNSRAKRRIRFVHDKYLPEGSPTGVRFSDKRAGTRQ